MDVTVAQGVQRLVDSGLSELTGVTPVALAEQAADLPQLAGAVLAVHPKLASAAQLAGLLRHRGNPGFVVEDMVDVDDFTPIDEVVVPDQPLYLVLDPSRGDHLRNLSPNEAGPEIAAAGRTPLTLTEGISWLIQYPSMLEAGACFMTIGSRKRTGSRVDARTPGIWISRGTGRDGGARRGAPKVGWCWAGNRHTWLGHASAAGRYPTPRAVGIGAAG